MKLLYAIGLIGLGMVAGQHAGEMGIDDKGNYDGAAELPSGPGVKDGADATPDASAQTDWHESQVHGSATKGRDEARGNQWERNQATAKEAKSTKTHVHVSINGIMTKKVPHCQEPFIVGDHTADSKIEDVKCEYPTNGDGDGCAFPLKKKEGASDSDPCEPMGPWCPHPLIFDTDALECIPMIPRIGKGNAILNNAYIGAVLRQDGADHNNKAPRVHQAVENDPNDNLMIKERHNEEQHLWNWEKVRRHTGH